MQLVFDNPMIHDRLMLGPFDLLELTADALRNAATKEEIALHRNGMWVARGQAYTAITILSPCVINFKHNDNETCSTERAGAAQARIVNGAIYHGDRLVATVSDSTWRIYEDKAHCDRAEFRPSE
jgi:hypothetical protein